jgi:hypothetical protein
MPQTSPLTAAQVRDLGAQFTQLLAAAGVTLDPTTVNEPVRDTLRKLGVALVEHTCTSTGRPLPYGKLAPEGKCERCDERRTEKAAGIAARSAPTWVERSQRRQETTNGYPTRAEHNDHFRPGGPHSSGACGPVCTFGDW